MKIALCSLVLNEQEFLLRSYNQHIGWPGLAAWIFIEGADKEYAKASPGKVTEHGLSTDETRGMLERCSGLDSRVKYERLGWMKGPRASSKSTGRNRYLDLLEEVQPDIFIVLDADEFYTWRDQRRIIDLVQLYPQFLSFRLPQRHIWRPPSIKDHWMLSPAQKGLFEYEVRGGYWDVPHVRVFRWQTGLRYKLNHNVPEARDYNAAKYMYRGSMYDPNDPQCIHLGFARQGEERLATNRYYQQRGEGIADGRQMYVDCRVAWENWQPGGKLPHGAEVVCYNGEIPEVYRSQQVPPSRPERGKG